MKKIGSSVFNIITICTIILGVTLALISGAQNFFLLFLGLGLIVFAIVALVINKQARYLFFPFIILLVIGLSIFNAIDFQANSFTIDFINNEGYTAYLYYDSPSDLLFEQSITEIEVASNLKLNEADWLMFGFEPQPILKGSDFILIDYISDQDSIQATWLWSDETDNAEMEVSDTPEENVTVQGDATESETTPSNQDVNLMTIILETESDSNILANGVSVNGEEFVPDRTQDNLYYFTSNKPIEQINQMQIVETRLPSTKNISSLQPKVKAIYLVESKPKPIIIERINLYKYLGSVKLYIPFYALKADEIQEKFNIINGEIIIQEDALYIVPAGVRPILQLKQSPALSSLAGLGNIVPYVLVGNIGLIILFLGAFIGVSLSLDKFPDLQRDWLGNLKNYSLRVFDIHFLNQDLKGITPLKLILMVFLFLTWIIIFLPIEPWGGTILKPIILIINVVLFVYIFKGVIFSNE